VWDVGWELPHGQLGLLLDILQRGDVVYGQEIMHDIALSTDGEVLENG
jgi:hypothetical protein